MTFAEGEVKALPNRRLTEETCKKWGYLVGSYKGKPVQIANYRDDSGTLVGQKIRFKDKTFTITGKLPGLYGQHLWREKGRKIVVTEGEIDALTVSQLQNNRWPVVSIANGAQSAKKTFAKSLDYLLGFDEVIILFDNDEPGNKAALECAELLPPGRAKIATLPMKDASDMMVAGRGPEVIDAIWGAKTFRPDGLVSLSDIRAEVLKSPEVGLPWVYPTLTKLTYGRRYGELYAVGAGTGIGKTDFLTQQITFDITVLKQKVGVIFFEQQPAETAKRLAGKLAGQRFHIPEAGWTQDQLITALDTLDAQDGLRFYNHFGQCEWSVVENRIRYMVAAEGIRIFYLDHLTALAAGQENEREALEKIMADLGSLVKELDIMIVLVSHLATPEGKPHEEGGRVMIRHFKGSRAIGFWCHFMFGLERNQQSDDEDERKTTTFRVLKDRHTGQSTGSTFFLGYDVETGALFETQPEFGTDDAADNNDAF